MKANRKFIDGEEAVSAVIGVILMVAITVAIAATVYVYVSGMMDVSGGSAPVAVININDGVATASSTTGLYNPGDEVFVLFHYSGDTIPMADVVIEYMGGAVTSWDTLIGSTTTGGLTAAAPADGFFQFGDEISVTAVDANTQAGVYTFRIRHNPTSSWVMPAKTATAV
ncbi:MAG: type IV pilin [Candidatus Thermoplasmatota archaeon]